MIGFISINKYVNQVVLINHSWISPTLQRGKGLKFCLFFKKWGMVHFFVHSKRRCWSNRRERR